MPIKAEQKNFDPERFVGKWYEIARNKFKNQKGKETTWDVSIDEENKKNIQTDIESLMPNGKRVANRVLANVIYNAQMKLKNKSSWFFNPFPNDITVVETDYELYAILQSKPWFEFWTLPYAWILVKQLPIEKAYFEYLYHVLENKAGVSKHSMEQVNHPNMFMRLAAEEDAY